MFDRRSLIVVGAIAFAMQPLGAWGQPPEAPAAAATAPNTRIITAGGFLGYLDALVTKDGPKGGLIGFQEWLEKERRLNQDIVLIAGNNMPHEPGGGFAAGDVWAGLRALQADAIALSIDDFRRTLRKPGSVATLVKELPSRSLPLVASNAVIKAYRKGLNIVESAGFELEVNADESLPWDSKLRVAGGKCLDVSVTLQDVTTLPAIDVPGECKDADGHFDYKLKAPLRPGGAYEMTVKPMLTARSTATFTFRTHRALISLDPIDKAGPVPAGLVGWPVRYVTRTIGGVEARLTIVSMVDPNTKKRLGSDRWKFTKAAGPCDGESCELDFLPAQDAFDLIATSIAATSDTTAQPLFVLMSGLSDSQTLRLLSKRPDMPGLPVAVPFVILDPDSFVLGRDIGYSSIVEGDSVQPSTADPLKRQMWVRPAWNAARASVLTARLAWRSNDKKWELNEPNVATVHVTGKPAEPRLSQNSVAYSVPTVPRPLGPFDAYGVYGGAALNPPDVWNSMAVLLLDVMRRKGHGDLALFPKHFIDEQIVEEVAASPRPLAFSRFIFSKLLYEQENIVAVDVEGSKLAAALEGIVKAQAADNESVYIAGIGTTAAVSKIDSKHLLINGRTIVPDHFYKVVMPQSIAEGQGLTVVDEEAVPSLLDAIDEHLRTQGGPVLRPSATLSEPETNFKGKRRLYLNLNPAKLSYFRGSPTDADLLGNIPLAGRSVKDERQWGASGRGEIGLDGLNAAYRGIFEAKFAKNIFATPPSYPEDEWTGGVRADRKVAAGAGRFFGGMFWQSQFREQRIDPITPSRKIDGSVTTSTGEVIAVAATTGAKVTIENVDKSDPDKPMFWFARVGVERGEWKLRPWLTLKDAAAAFDWGKAYNSRTDVVLEQLGTFPIGEVYRKGLKTFVEKQFAANPAAFASPQTLTFDHLDYEQKRFQFDGTLAYKGQSGWPRWTKDTAVSLTTQFRRYLGDSTRPDFTANWSLELKSQVEWTVLHRLKLGPYANYYRVAVKWPSSEPVPPKPLDYVKIGFELNVPIFISARPAWAFQ
jgi:hypothetical protein